MFAPLLLIIASLVSFVLAQTPLTINTPVPNPVACEPEQLNWGGGAGAPYFITVVDSDDRTNTLVNFGTLTNTSLTWFVTLPVGTNCLLTIKDSSGAGQTSGIFSIAGGGPTNCLGGGSASGSGSGSASNSATPSKSGSATGKSSVPSTTPATTQSSKAATTPSNTVTPPSTAQSQSVTQPASSGASSVSTAPSSTAHSGGAPTNVPAVAAAAVGVLFAALL